MRKERCETCYWWDRKPEPAPDGLCRGVAPKAGKYPPWPETYPGDWCRFHKLSEALQAEHDQMLADLVAGEG